MNIYRDVRDRLQAAWELIIRLDALALERAGLIGGVRHSHIQVPLRCDGRGVVMLRTDCSIGYRLAPKTGFGTVLLQARTPDSLIDIGDRTMVSNNTSIIAMSKITIGQDGLIGDGVLIVDSDFHGMAISERRTSTGKTEEVKLGNNVWIGSRAVILRGTQIGDGCIVGAGAVAKGVYPAHSIIAGNPARVVGQIDPPHVEHARL